jgi:hypothetical protein
MVRFGAGDLRYRTKHRLFQTARTIFGAECAYIQRRPGEKLQATTTPHCRDAGGAGRMVQAAMTMLFSTVVTPAAAQARRSTRRRWVEDPTVPLNVSVWS